MRTVAELKRLMRTRVGQQSGGETMIETVIGLLKEQRYLNDSNFAASYSSYRKENEKFGRMRVVQDLKAKGVHGDVIAKAVNATYDGVNEEKLAREFLQRKRVQAPADQKQAARVFRMLARAGFSTRVAVGILKRWNVDDETVSALEQERNEAEERGEMEE
jgi:regulatory protein